MSYRTDKTDDAPDFTVVIVTYNGGDFVERCVRSVFGAAGGKSVEAIVVDNASTDGSAEAAEAVGNV
jgi:glycosyltransferase involved in cell wall biosynthesis